MENFQVSKSGTNNERVIFLLSGWQNRMWQFWLFSKILAYNGYFCITYTYDDKIFSPDTTKTVHRLFGVRDDILKRITVFKKNGGKNFSVFGTSLGSLIALMVANKSPDISKVILNTTGADVSESVWTWNKVFPWFKNKLVKQKMTLTKLKKSWAPITPLNNIDNLKNKKILIYLSENDEIIPFEQGKRLVKEYKKRRYDYTLITNKRLMHVLTGLYNLINFGIYISFLKS